MSISERGPSSKAGEGAHLISLRLPHNLPTINRGVLAADIVLALKRCKLQVRAYVNVRIETMETSA
jgi:hypothetical protein